MTWAIYDAPPFMIAEGADAESGIFDRIRNLLSHQLGDLPQAVLTAPFPRIVTALKAGADWCFIGGVKTPERETFAVFSKPVAMFYPLRVVINSADRARFEALQPLSLLLLMRDHPELQTSVLRNRSFGPQFDALQNAYPAANQHSDFLEAFRMLMNRRLDYLVEYSNIATYHARRLGKPDGLVLLPMTEVSEPVYARVMCARTAQGLAVVDRIDHVLDQERDTPAYRAIVEAWSAPADQAKIRAIYDSQFLTAR
ncbi:hypothetical protein BTR14_10875 [Rhizobium rhizosphaerae]|uniref:Solute-binding protein family 3/N-terminal domain-containing protein n=1 Tax=Xaviernesmea rhizosphaerae TaxID=1672749 RepID=A0ABX3PE14_9HYPH|nr:transporter substrate-binding domain-containing protein [Xaviernesmea rhizosphaerae]OQP86504.1 hypothetical protein BTR14_10875 [Xaviernesmea rhizosphaerae]